MYSRIKLTCFLLFFTVACLNAQNSEKIGKVQINPQAPVKCSKTVVINANVMKVWLILSNIDRWNSWQTDISKAKLSGPLQPGSTFTWEAGGFGITSVLHTVEPNKSIGWTGKSYGIKAVHNWTLQESNGKTIVRVEESMEGFLARLFKKSFNKDLEKGMLHWLELLKQKSEHV
jgi:uncharacterized protein YndB with AHSA1/START domain